MPVKTFTLAEANALIPELDALLAEMQSLRQQLVAEAPALESVISNAGGNGGSKAAGEYLLRLQRFAALQTLIAEMGCELKDLNTGLVDFPSYRDGQLVYLCWKQGEPSIQFWHALDAGFAGRQPL